MKEKIDKFIQYFTTITKEECDPLDAITKLSGKTGEVNVI